MNPLYSYAREEASLEGALEHCKDALRVAPSVALLYAFDECFFGLFDGDGALTGADGERIDLAPVYEARVFNRNVELRWLNRSRGMGKTVLLSEKQFKVAGFQDLAPIEPCDVIKQTYLLWGEGVDVELKTGWSRLTTARIGRLQAPVTGVKAGDRVLIEAVEYLAIFDSHGNVSVVEERLTSFKVDTTQANNKER